MLRGSYQDFKIVASLAVLFYLPGSQLLDGYSTVAQAAIAGFTSGATGRGGDIEAALKGAFTAAALAGVSTASIGSGRPLTQGASILCPQLWTEQTAWPAA